MLQLFFSRHRFSKIKAPTLAALLVIGIVVSAIPIAIKSAGSAYLMVDDTVLLAPVHNNVTVYRDNWGVPHIYAQDTYDAYYALGYAMAEDRLFEMDLFRRAVAGRLSEIFNGLMFEDDVVMRTLGPYQIAVDTWNGLYPGVVIPDDVRENLERFSDGVNRYISDMVVPDDVPTEYRIISAQTGGLLPVSYFVPYPWTPPDSVAIAGMMGLMLTDSSEAEIIRGAFVANVDPMYAMAGLPGMSDFLMPTGWVNSTTIMDPPGGGGGLGDLGVIEAITAPLQKLLGFSGFSGSNNWVVDDLNTTTGNAMLANDPHLDLQTPGMWWQVHINIPGYTNTIGCMVPGGPVVATGHNDYFAFGVTNLMADIMDLYYYVSNATHYFYVDHWEPFDVRYETIYNFTTPVSVPVVSTRHGPMITTPLPPPFDKMAVRWGGKEAGYGDLTGFALMLNATTLADWKHACSYMSVIIQNFVFADKLGNIAWCPSGKIPLRPPPPPAGTGTLGVAPSNGSAGQNEWMGWLPHSTAPVDYGFDPWPGPVSLPYVENPPEGYIATANNQPIDPNYFGYPWPIWIGPAYTYDAGYRAQRIVELIEGLEPISIDDMKLIQSDVLCIPARNMLPIIQAVMAGESNVTMQNALAVLGAWNFTELRGLAAPLIWEEFLEKFADNTFGDELWAAMGLYPFGNTIIPLWNMTQTWNWNPYAIALFDDQTTPSAGPFTPGFEFMPEIVNKSLHDALDWIASRIGPPADAAFSNWQYGDLHVVDFNHPMGRLSPLVSWLNVPPGNQFGPLPVGMDGGPYTVNPGGHYHELIVTQVVDFVENGASYRGIYECYDDWDTSLILVPPGESGSIKGSALAPVLDPHYGDTFLLWLNYGYTPCLFDDTTIQTYSKTIFMKPTFQTWSFNVIQYDQTFRIDIETNSTDVTNLLFFRGLKRLQFDVEGFECTTGVCTVTIPKELLDGPWTILVGGSPVTPVVTGNATHSFLEFSYHHSVLPVSITGTSVIQPPPPPVGGIATPLDILPSLIVIAIAVIAGLAIGIGALAVFVKRRTEKR